MRCSPKSQYSPDNLHQREPYPRRDDLKHEVVCAGHHRFRQHCKVIEHINGLGIMPTMYPQVKSVFIFCDDKRFGDWSSMELCSDRRTLKSVPCMFSSSLIPDTYALFTFDLSRSTPHGSRSSDATSASSRADGRTIRKILRIH